MKLECQNCGMVGDEEEFPYAKDVAQRHDLGDTFSDRECPDCAGLAFPTDEKKLGELCEFVERIARIDEKKLGELCEFVERIARMKLDSEDQWPNGDEPLLALEHLIAEARKLTGIDPGYAQDEEPVTDERG